MENTVAINKKSSNTLGTQHSLVAPFLNGIIAVILSALFGYPLAGTAQDNQPDHVSQPAGPPVQFEQFEGKIEPGKIYLIEANADKGFYWPYFMTIPDTVVTGNPVYVQPNNDGRSGAPYATHLYWAGLVAEQSRYDHSNKINTIGIVPVFPRPLAEDGDNNLYVHALTREVLLEKEDSLVRIDLQLIAMVDDVRSKLPELEIPSDALFYGFSASADFVTRMAVLHPDRVMAVAAGGLGGFPILPMPELARSKLTYPVGTHDLERLVGHTFDSIGFLKIPCLLFQGSLDDNDSVPEDDAWEDKDFDSDSYSMSQTYFVNGLFGSDPVKRVAKVSRIYQVAGMQDFKYAIVPDIGHTAPPEVDREVVEFFRCVMSGDGSCAGDRFSH